MLCILAPDDQQVTNYHFEVSISASIEETCWRVDGKHFVGGLSSSLASCTCLDYKTTHVHCSRRRGLRTRWPALLNQKLTTRGKQQA